jgi:hypothetical protein
MHKMTPDHGPERTLTLTLLLSMPQTACSGLRDLSIECSDGFEERGTTFLKVSHVHIWQAPGLIRVRICSCR